MANMSRNFKKLEKILDDYGDEFVIEFQDSKRMQCCPLPKSRRIFVHTKQFTNPTNEDLLDWLHEIGHLKTYDKKFRRVEEEYYATQWAFDHADEYNVKVTERLMEAFQRYVDSCYEISKRRKAKNLPEKDFFLLKY